MRNKFQKRRKRLPEKFLMNIGRDFKKLPCLGHS